MYSIKKYDKSLKLIDGIIHDVSMLGQEYNTLRINILYASYINKAYVVKATDNNYEDALLLLQKLIVLLWSLALRTNLIVIH